MQRKAICDKGLKKKDTKEKIKIGETTQALDRRRLQKSFINR